jgi:tetratricopeptide (TPR) repeat protein
MYKLRKLICFQFLIKISLLLVVLTTSNILSADTIMNKIDSHFTLENFDELFTGNPVDIEKNMTTLLPEAENREDKSIYLQILSQIALAQAMQQNFDLAHKTLDMADGLLEPRYELAQIRLLLERGGFYHQSGNTDKALPLFIKSYEQAKLKKDFDFHTVNAAHMVAIVANNVDDKIKWNKIAIALAEKTSDERCQTWLGAIHNNLAQNYIEAEKYSEALESFKKCKAYAKERGDPIVIRGAAWGIARSLRSLNQLEKALEIQKDLLIQYEDISSKQLLPI